LRFSLLAGRIGEPKAGPEQSKTQNHWAEKYRLFNTKEVVMMNKETYGRLCPECKKMVWESVKEQMNLESGLGMDESVFARRAEYEDVSE
jgi:hypothetical protein